MRNPLRPVFLLTAMVLLVAAGTGLAQWIGEIEAWGLNDYNQCDVPDSAPFVAVSAGNEHSLGLREDGSIVVWGCNENGQCKVPEPNDGFVAVAGGGQHCLGLKADGSIVAWGKNQGGQCNVPSPNEDFVAVAGGNEHSLGLKKMAPSWRGAPTRAARAMYLHPMRISWLLR